MALADDLAQALETACANHIRWHNRGDADLLQMRRDLWRRVAELIVDTRCLKTPRKK